MILLTGRKRPIVELLRRLVVRRAFLEHSALAGDSGDRIALVDAPGLLAPAEFILTCTRQYFGGQRWWFRCDCGRRCGVLLSRGRGTPYMCRLCLGAGYLRDHPSERPFLVYQQLSGWQPGPEDLWREITRLLAARRKGVRRGRRVRERVRRLMALPPEQEQLGAPIRIDWPPVRTMAARGEAAIGLPLMSIPTVDR